MLIHRTGLRPWRRLRNLTSQLFHRGFCWTARWYRHRLYEAYRDWRLGISTMGYIDRSVLSSNPHCHGYDPLDYRSLDAFFRYSPAVPHQDVFLDYGCGKGRAVVVAAQQPFRRVIGVEMGQELSDFARQNVRQATRKLQCSAVDIVTANAADFEVPADVTRVFMFNPFSGDVMTNVLRRLRQSLAEAPRKLKLFYAHPDYVPDALANCEWLRVRQKRRSFWWDEVWCVLYESVDSLPALTRHAD